MRSMKKLANSARIVSHYNLKSLGAFGAEVQDLDLSSLVPPFLISQIRQDVVQHEFLLFKNQKKVTGSRMLEIARWFGEVDDTPLKGYPVHAKAPHHAVLRLSNDEAEGHQEFGTTGFHVDGSFLQKPNTHAIYHMLKSSQGGNTLFTSMTGVLQHAPEARKEFWDRLWLVRDTRDGQTVVHPLLYRHPHSGMQTLCIHLGNLSHFVADYGSKQESALSAEDSQQIAKDIETEFYRDDGRFIYEHQWDDWDLIISDNLSLAHKATAATQLPKEQVGLRIFQRVVTKGQYRPSKS